MLESAYLHIVMYIPICTHAKDLVPGLLPIHTYALSVLPFPVFICCHRIYIGEFPDIATQHPQARLTMPAFLYYVLPFGFPLLLASVEHMVNM